MLSKYNKYYIIILIVLFYNNYNNIIANEALDDKWNQEENIDNSLSNCDMDNSLSNSDMDNSLFLDDNIVDNEYIKVNKNLSKGTKRSFGIIGFAIAFSFIIKYFSQPKPIDIDHNRINITNQLPINQLPTNQLPSVTKETQLQPPIKSPQQQFSQKNLFADVNHSIYKNKDDDESKDVFTLNTLPDLNNLFQQIAQNKTIDNNQLLLIANDFSKLPVNEQFICLLTSYHHTEKFDYYEYVQINLFIYILILLESWEIEKLLQLKENYTLNNEIYMYLQLYQIILSYGDKEEENYEENQKKIFVTLFSNNSNDLAKQILQINGMIRTMVNQKDKKDILNLLLISYNFSDIIKLKYNTIETNLFKYIITLLDESSITDLLQKINELTENEFNLGEKKNIISMNLQLWNIFLTYGNKNSPKNQENQQQNLFLTILSNNINLTKPQKRAINNIVKNILKKQDNLEDLLKILLISFNFSNIQWNYNKINTTLFRCIIILLKKEEVPFLLNKLNSLDTQYLSNFNLNEDQKKNIGMSLKLWGIILEYAFDFINLGNSKNHKQLFLIFFSNNPNLIQEKIKEIQAMVKNILMIPKKNAAVTTITQSIKKLFKKNNTQSIDINDVDTKKIQDKQGALLNLLLISDNFRDILQWDEDNQRNISLFDYLLSQLPNEYQSGLLFISPLNAEKLKIFNINEEDKNKIIELLKPS